MDAINAQGIKVVINGQGADEALAGYGRLIAGYRILDLLQTYPGQALHEMQAIHQRMGLSYGYIVAQTVKALLGRRRALQFRAHYAEGGSKVLQQEFSKRAQKYLPDVKATGSGENLYRHLRSQLLDYGLNQILHYEDQSSMSHSIEIRSPFMDYRLLEFAFSLPSNALFSDGQTKRLLREGFKGALPELIRSNHQKIGFATPFEQWSRTDDFRKFTYDLTRSTSFQQRSVWNSKKLAAQLNDPNAIRRGFPSWRFICAELWMQMYGITNA